MAQDIFVALVLLTMVDHTKSPTFKRFWWLPWPLTMTMFPS